MLPDGPCAPVAPLPATLTFAFQVAFAFVPSREAFLNRLAGGKYCGRTAADMAAYVDQFSALLAEVHKFLVRVLSDDPGGNLLPRISIATVLCPDRGCVLP
jgi:hypothetical protein